MYSYLIDLTFDFLFCFSVCFVRFVHCDVFWLWIWIIDADDNYLHVLSLFNILVSPTVNCFILTSDKEQGTAASLHFSIGNIWDCLLHSGPCDYEETQQNKSKQKIQLHKKSSTLFMNNEGQNQTVLLGNSLAVQREKFTEMYLIHLTWS